MCWVQALSAVASIGQGMAQSSAYNAQAKIANQNAQLANQQANLVQEKKQQEIADINEKKRQTQGAQMAALAANGSDTSMGSGLGILTDTAYQAQRDINNTEYNADMDSWGYRAQAVDYKNQASAYRSAGSNAMTMGILGGIGSYMAGQTPYKTKTAQKAGGVKSGG